MQILIKGAGDLASGVAFRLHKAGFPVMMTEIAQPTVIRRRVSFAQAVYDGQAMVEDVAGVLVPDVAAGLAVQLQGQIPVLVDPEARCRQVLRPEVVVDAILAKENLGTHIQEAPMVIALGPGFEAGKDVHAVVETQRGHDLGRVYLQGTAIPNTGVPGEIGGKSLERLLRAPAAGVFAPCRRIGDLVQAGETVATCGGQALVSQIDGYLRGILQEGLTVEAGMKVGDVDPRCQESHCYTISDKARALGGAVLEAILYLAQGLGYQLVQTEAK